VAAEFLPIVRERLAADKLRRGQFDYTDMLALVWQALEGSGGEQLAARLRARYRHALIDEFQDTDALQWNIFRRIYVDTGDSFLTVVGDPKQAIYHFRGADILTYLSARDELLEAGGQRTDLDTNYRSTSELVDAYNLVLAQGQPFFSGGITYAPVQAGSALRASVAGAPSAPAHILHLVPSGDTFDSEGLRALLAERIVGEIHSLLYDPTKKIRLEDPERGTDQREQWPRLCELPGYRLRSTSKMVCLRHPSAEMSVTCLPRWPIREIALCDTVHGKPHSLASHYPICQSSRTPTIQPRISLVCTSGICSPSAITTNTCSPRSPPSLV
jgi:hypothetical protein